MSRAPHVSVTDPSGRAFFSVELSWGGWATMRKIADQAECTCFETRVGLFTKEFVIRGDEAALNKLVGLVWDDPVLGQSFRNEIRKVTQC
jgi:hypothetical protein